MNAYVMDLRELDRTRAARAGGKGANLGELSRIEGIRVPPGFCVTTDAFRRGMTDDVAAAITRALAALGEDAAYAVRSSATAEDSPTTSFAGQHDTYLNVVGREAILEHVRRAWASLTTERAVAYRARSGIDDGTVQMAVVVQRMVAPRAAGVLFTADPLTSNRNVASVEAVRGLGEDLVSGAVNPDVHKVRDGEIVTTSVDEQPALTDAQVAELVRLGRRIEAHFGAPQDIEWCLAGDGRFDIVQSRPITTLFPIPAADDDENHVYISVGHQQMMTDAMKPLGLSVWQLIALPRMYEAGGRLFVDVAQRLASPAARAALIELIGKSDPLIGDALRTVLDRGFIPTVPDDGPAGPPAGAGAGPPPIETDPAIVSDAIERADASLAELKREIRAHSGPALFDFVLADVQVLKGMLRDPRTHQLIMASMEATWWLNDQLEEWLGEKNAADTLTLSVPDNITSEMGLALLDVADAIRPHPDVVAFLERVEDDDFLDDLAALPGGREARDAIQAYLDRYGMRCIGEIDITRPRWSERPTELVPAILGNVRNFEPGAGPRRFEQGRQEAADKEQEVLERLRALPDGEQKAGETKRMIDRVRTFAGYREYPKYDIVRRLFVWKQALLAEAERLVDAGVLAEQEDSFHLTFQELAEAVRTQHVDDGLIARRKETFRANAALTPPRVLTSEGEAVAGAYRRDDVPDGALIGLPVSRGTVEGRARVVLDMADADLEPGDILVTAFTDPSWTPVFVAIDGLVTEVGGLMTHGAVIAREYGLPAVVGVEHATRRIRDGQRIRVHATEGYIELL
jgi:rifampicin phosphotransferase